MRIRSDSEKIRSFMITHLSETDHYGEMMKNYFRTELARVPVADYSGITLAQWRPRKRAILAKLTEAVGGFPARKCPLSPRITGKVDRDGYTLESLYFQSRPNWPVSALLYVPKGVKGRAPAVVVVHGHSFTQKAAPVYQKVAVDLARNGYVVMAVDFVGGGDRLAQKHESRYIFAAGKTVMSIMVWDNMRAIDYLSTRREVDPKKIGITGSSGGGNQSAFTTVFDERIAAAAPVNAVTMFAEHSGIGCDYLCPCEVVPGIWQFAEYSDLMATVAPRPLLLVQAIKDRLFPVKGTREVYYRAREVYKAFGAAGNIEVAEDYGPHSYSSAARAAVIGWFDRHLKGVEPKPFEEYEDFVTYEDERSEALSVFPGGKLPRGSLTLAGLYGTLSEKLPGIKRPRAKRSYAAYRRKVRSHVTRLAGRPEKHPLDIETFPTAEASWATLTPFAFTSERGIVIPSVLVAPKDGAASRVVIHAHPQGKARTVGLRAVEKLVGSGAAVLAVDLRSTGETQGLSPGETSEPYGFILNRSLLLGRHISLMRAFDITRAVDCIRALPGCGRLPVYLWAEGHMSTPALFAFALDTRIKRLAASELLLTYRSDEGFAQDDSVFVPGILTGADVSDILAACVERKVLLTRPELPSGRVAAPKTAEKILEPAIRCAQLTGSNAPIVASGGFTETENGIQAFLTT